MRICALRGGRRGRRRAGAHRELVGGERLRPVIGDEDRVGPDGLDHGRRQRDRSAPGLHGDELPIDETEPLGQGRVHLARGPRRMVDEELDPAGLRPAEVVEHGPPGRHVDGVLGVGRLGAEAVRRGMQVELAVGVVAAPVLEQPRGARVALGRARPEDAHLALDALVGDAGVVGGAAGAGAAELVEDGLGVAEIELVRASQAARQLEEDRGVGARPGGRRHRGAEAHHARLGGRRRALLLLVQRAGQHHVRVPRRLAHEEVDDARGTRAARAPRARSSRRGGSPSGCSRC